VWKSSGEDEDCNNDGTVVNYENDGGWDVNKVMMEEKEEWMKVEEEN
jgi:hypothetical protein